MRKLAATALATLTFAGAIAAASPASADRYRRHHHRGGGDDEVAAAILGGIAGLAIGSALGSSSRNRSYGYYGTGYSYDPRYDSYGRGYYARPHRYYDRPYYRTCVRTERFYDPYVGHHVKVRRRYPC